MKLHVALRTCDRVSLQNNRMFDKTVVIKTCVGSLIESLELYGNYELVIFDDMSSDATRNWLIDISNTVTNGKIVLQFINDKPEYYQNGNSLLKSRYSVKLAYEYLYSLPEDSIFLITEDDYLYEKYAISSMINSYMKFVSWFPETFIGIFPQDFNQLYYDPNNPFNETYVKPCHVLAGVDRYYRTTWFTQETFLFSVSGLNKYKLDFDSLLKIGEIEGYWEATTISFVWQKPDVMMLMPLGTLALHISSERDISYFVDNTWKLKFEL